MVPLAASLRSARESHNRKNIISNTENVISVSRHRRR